MTALATGAVVAVAGGLGAIGRYLLDTSLQRRFGRIAPVGTMSVNAIGSFVLGLATGLVAHHGLSTHAVTVVGVGFCGGLTTFSTASFETVRLAREGFGRVALFSALGGFSISCIAASLGLLFALL